jgi:uncharacterized protein YecE (DUF72 family)
MKYFVGTSGHSYAAWKGIFYPRTLPSGEMLAFYASQFSAVENNGTFRKLPTIEAAQTWTKDVPKTFQFALKAPQSITHFRRLNNVEDITNQLLTLANSLKKNRGPVLFQLPPNFKKDIDRLDAFLTLVHRRAPVAFEFRHASWFDRETFACLKSHAAALCIADAADLPQIDFVTTAKWAYLRLRRERYSTKQLQTWIEKLEGAKLREAYVFFKHEDAGTGPKLARRFMKLVDS